MHITWTKGNGLVRSVLAPLLLFLLFAGFLYLGANSVSKTSNEENMRILQDAANRAVVQCYAAEGMYPPDINYLEENYGLLVDYENYIIHYEAFAANVFPTVIVVSLNE